MVRNTCDEPRPQVSDSVDLPVDRSEVLAIAEQTKLFDVIDGATIGVGLTSSYLMSPLKSVSGLIGLGPPEDIQQYGSPCDRCELSNCDMRRSAS